MCATIIWAVNAAAFTRGFITGTERLLGIAPAPTELRIATAHLRANASHFTMTKNSCDCRALIGLGKDRIRDDEIAAEPLLHWLRELPKLAHYLSHLAVLRAWNPGSTPTLAASASRIAIVDVDEHLLRKVADDELLIIDY